MSKIYLVLDRSGSMEPYVNSTVKGVNSFISKQSDDTKFTIILFNDSIKTVSSNDNKENVRPLSGINYRPQGGTALLDAIGYTLKQAADDEPKLWADQDESQITVVILTDGVENCSKEHTMSSIRETIQFNRLKGWNFIFMGANQDAFEVAGAIGIQREATLDFDVNRIETAISSASSAISRMSTGESQTIEFTPIERTMSSQVV